MTENAAKEAFDLLKKYENELTLNEEGDRIIDIREAWDDSLHSLPAPCESATQAVESIVSSDEETLLDLVDNLPAGSESVSSDKRERNIFPALKKGFLVQNRPTIGPNDSCSMQVEEKGVTASKPCLKKNEPREESRPISKFKQRIMRYE